MRSWVVEGPRKEAIDDEVSFVDPRVLSAMLAAKSELDAIPTDERRAFNDARMRANPLGGLLGCL